MGKKIKSLILIFILSFLIHDQSWASSPHLTESEDVLLIQNVSQGLEIDRWLKEECFKDNLCCPNPKESALYWSGASLSLTTTPVMYTMGTDLAAELQKNNYNAGSLAPLMGVGSMLSNGVVYSVSVAEAMENLQRPSTLENSIILHDSFKNKAIQTIIKLAGPGQLSVGAALALTIYNHTRLSPTMGKWIYPLDVGLIFAASLSDYYFWQVLIREGPLNIRSNYKKLMDQTEYALSLRDVLRLKTAQLSNYLLNAPLRDIRELHSQITDEKSGLKKFQILLERLTPKGNTQSKLTLIYDEGLGISGSIIGIIACYPNYFFTYKLSIDFLLTIGMHDSLPAKIISSWLALCGTLSVVTSNTVGGYYSYKNTAQASREYGSYVIDLVKKRKKPKCCKTKEEVAHALALVGKHVAAPLAYVGVSLISIIPQEYIGLVGSSQSLVSLGVTTIALSGVAIAYWGFDSFIKKNTSHPKRQSLLQSVSKISRLLPDARQSVIDYLSGSSSIYNINESVELLEER